MRITIDKVRNELNLDDVAWDNAKIERLMLSAKATIVAEIGVLPKIISEEFDNISDTYIVEYCRGFLSPAVNTGMVNERILLALSIKMQAVKNG